MFLECFLDSYRQQALYARPLSRSRGEKVRTTAISLAAFKFLYERVKVDDSDTDTQKCCLMLLNVPATSATIPTSRGTDTYTASTSYKLQLEHVKYARDDSRTVQDLRRLVGVP